MPQHGGALTVAGVVVGNWKSRGKDSFVKVVDHATARTAPPKQLAPVPVIASISYVSCSCTVFCTRAYRDHACQPVCIHWQQINIHQ